MPHTPSDALVFFGATGDLAYKQIFPALLALVRDGQLDVPIIGVGRSGMTAEQLVERARASVKEHGRWDEAAFARLARLLKHVGGDYNSQELFQRLRETLGWSRGWRRRDARKARGSSSRSRSDAISRPRTN
jgi:glucose-6-phosphate 1-dehydrogenase